MQKQEMYPKVRDRHRVPIRCRASSFSHTTTVADASGGPSAAGSAAGGQAQPSRRRHTAYVDARIGADQLVYGRSPYSRGSETSCSSQHVEVLKNEVGMPVKSCEGTFQMLDGKKRSRTWSLFRRQEEGPHSQQQQYHLHNHHQKQQQLSGNVEKQRRASWALSFVWDSFADAAKNLKRRMSRKDSGVDLDQPSPDEMDSVRGEIHLGNNEPPEISSIVNREIRFDDDGDRFMPESTMAEHVDVVMSGRPARLNFWPPMSSAPESVSRMPSSPQYGSVPSPDQDELDEIATALEEARRKGRFEKESIEKRFEKCERPDPEKQEQAGDDCNQSLLAQAERREARPSPRAHSDYSSSGLSSGNASSTDVSLHQQRPLSFVKRQ